MAEPLDDRDKAHDFALRPPSIQLSPSYGMPALLKETELETYWQSPHYENYPVVLVRRNPSDPLRVHRVIRLAYEQAMAKKPVRKRRK